jgi:signal transduction histidine kinase
MADPDTRPDVLAAHLREVITEFSWGVAHDFSNFVQVILGFAEFLRVQHAQDEELAQNLGEIVVAAERAKRFIGQLLIVAKRGEFTLAPADLNELVRRLEPALKTALGDRIRLELRLAPGPMPLPLDVPGVEQILTHLCAQARDAMAQQGGTLTVMTQAAHRPGGECVRLSVQDTGAPVEPALAARIAEPYFMKRRGRGRGLEFAVVYELMDAYGGAVEVDAASGTGAAFHLYFPRLRRGAAGGVSPAVG